ncbi:FAD/NAD(P)-binding domain-containing protein [Aspergillus heteromorphus CBS 117.55]|uniref:FAD/NAD(P)-binding domain-containing protein n=1 Tax=Aspergillus heteromorphus CBS 117.55 TaxID=1448321 RepID=A0A317VPL1_9EURO|nr:FAD/NAD(P)-binding domain-containing protein [Aspergillus heteromorphus CBS 117.55]PWY74997.1 FAD/NAD(P)-binding domain-containing protein [Aspergillus heteromorphus CBS 117.55]
MDSEPLDVLIVGAGISGINAAYRVQKQFPHYRYAIIEARESLGGTWDLFKYPGIRSDSDLFTFGFEWYPWDRENPIAEGPSIVQYLHRATAKYGIDKHIRYQHRLLGADWSSSDQLWSLSVDHDGQSRPLSARFVVFGTGYYDYHQPMQADIPNLERFGGEVIHPQFWPEDLDYGDKNIVLIGSGATAITLLPKLAEKAARVTMLQRSPTYILSLPNRNRSWLSWILPTAAFRRVQRMSWFITSHLFFLFCQAFPGAARLLLRLSVSRQLPASLPFAPHFKPRYGPWDQRLCVCPDGDFFRALHTGHADIKTDTIRNVTETGIELTSGETLPADLIVTATGLRLQIAGGASITVDGIPMHLPDKFLWHSMMVQDLPNAAFVIGYTNASWTLGADATALFLCRLMQEMENRGSTAVIPRVDRADVGKLQPRRLLNLNSTYVTKAEGALPKAADRGPWVPRGNYLQDVWFAQHGPMTDLQWEGAKKEQ